MSVLIKGMGLPKDCAVCPMLNGADECCLLSQEQHDTYEGEMVNVQAAFCPLVEVPTPHGDLADVDEIIDDIAESRAFQGDALLILQDIFNDAPTVIEAEEG